MAYAFGDKSKNSLHPTLPPESIFFPQSLIFILSLKSALHIKLTFYEVHDLRLLVLFSFIACVYMIFPEPFVEKAFSSLNFLRSFVKS